MVAGTLGQAQTLPLGIPLLLLAIVGCSLWAGLAGRYRLVNVLLVNLAGMVAGGLVPYVPSHLPQAEIVLPLLVTATGALIAIAGPSVPGVAAAVMVLIGVLIGLRLPFGWEVQTWIGFACGTLVAAACGGGLSVVLKRHSARFSVQLFGLGVAGLGAWQLIPAA